MGITNLRVNDCIAYDMTSVASYPWVFRRGINATLNLSPTLVSDSNLNIIRRRPPVTWSPTGVGFRYTPTIDYATFDAWIDSLPSMCKVIIDPHTAPGFHLSHTTWADDVFWFSLDWHDNVVDLYGQLAVHYRNYGDRIAGYSLMNEPNTPCRKQKISPYPQIIQSAADIPTSAQWNALIAKWQALGWGGPTTPPVWNVGDRDPRSYRNLGERCVTAIRGADNVHTIIYMRESYGGTQPTGTGINMGPYQPRNHYPKWWYTVSDHNIVYAYHLYEPPKYMIRGLDPPPPSKATIQGYLADIRNWQLANPTLRAVFTEVGPTKPFANNADQVLRWMCEVCDEYEITWLHHTLTHTGSESDAAVSTSFLAVLREFWANNT